MQYLRKTKIAGPTPSHSSTGAGRSDVKSCQVLEADRLECRARVRARALSDGKYQRLASPPLVSLPYSVQTNDVPAYFEMKVSVPEFEAMLKRQFDTLYREDETVPRVMAIASGIGARAPFRGRLFPPVDDDPAPGWQGSASMDTTVTTTENPAARRQRDPWNKGRLERRCRCLKINLTLTSSANTGYPHPLPGARGRPERALRPC
jgi:hypothetical protein